MLRLYAHQISEASHSGALIAVNRQDLHYLVRGLALGARASARLKSHRRKRRH